MTKKLRESLNLPPIPEPEPTAESADRTVPVTVEGSSDHTRELHDVFNEVLGHARDLMEFGFNVDPPRAGRIFEIAGQFYGHAISAVNAKRDAQLKTIRLALEKRRVDLEEKRTNHVVGQFAATSEDDGATIIVEDRNDLLRRLRDQIKDESAS
jgi:hypothetical protein